MHVSTAPESACPQERNMSMSMKQRFVTRLRSNVEAWRAGEIDYATFTENQRETWQAIHDAGAAVEAAVVREVNGAARTAEVSPLVNAERLTVRYRAVSQGVRQHDGRRYWGHVERTAAGSPVLALAAADPHSFCAEHRQLAAFIYELAADMERRSLPLGVHWTISPDTENRRVVIELTGDHEAELADEFVAIVMVHHQLT